jgi:hypothetical protein
MKNTIYIGFDPREADGFAVTRRSIQNHCNTPIPVFGLVLPMLKDMGFFSRKQYIEDGQLYDEISQAPCATEFSISRFLTPILAQSGWAMFCDSDMLFRRDVHHLFEGLDPSKPMYCVKHNHNPTAKVKMDNQIQTQYNCKNWSSVMIFNCDHPKTRRLTTELVNTVPGRDLHRFCWLDDLDEDVGALDERWNWLSGHSDPNLDPYNVHFTEGLPSMPGYEDIQFADEWREELGNWAIK